MISELSLDLDFPTTVRRSIITKSSLTVYYIQSHGQAPILFVLEAKSGTAAALRAMVVLHRAGPLKLCHQSLLQVITTIPKYKMHLPN